MNNPLFVVSPGLYIWSLVIFLLVLLILKKYAWTPLLDFLDQREKEISDSLAMAESAKADLEKVKEESEKILNEAKNQGKSIVSDSKQKAEDSANKILNDAKAKSDEFVLDAKKKIDVEKKKAIKEIKEEVVGLSLDLASQVLQRNVKDEDNNKFVDSSLKAINTDEAKS
ncbi:MAG: ATP synthase subunit b [Candidatus Neomarinimicrobiota bacterium]|jgi:F-type H+-transporting ATPase subunit b|nr:MAG: ATP synthase subunit b [Candidatus Neomarinimicrobiota bacterium]|tara:strand:- start:181 stop:690 length:510 start_codon:yes stop_codon:yes gene_type:complete